MNSHLFVNCSRVYRLWAKMAQLWDINFVGASDVASTYVSGIMHIQEVLKFIFGEWCLCSSLGYMEDEK